MACSNSNSTALLKAKQLQQNFQRFCQMELTVKKNTKNMKNTKTDKNVRKLVVYHAKL